MLPDGLARHAVGREPVAQPARIVRQQPRSGVGLEKRLVMPRAVRLIAVRQRERAVERVGMRARQHREGGEALGSAVRDPPRGKKRLRATLRLRSLYTLCLVPLLNCGLADFA